MPTAIIDYAPRVLQREVHTALDTHRFCVIVCHRRFGKTVLGVNHLVKGALTNQNPRPRFGYIGPTYTQSKAVCWDYAQHYSSVIPDVRVNQSELRIDYPNEGQVRLYGADNPDSLRGLYFDGVALDEYGMHPPKTFTEVIGPTLVDRGGWGLFMGTPNGKNQFYDIATEAKARMVAGDKDWWFAEYKASATGLLDPGYLQSARSVMTADEYQQEFECSFEASVKGAIYAAELHQCITDQRVTRVPVDPILPVDTYWDLGVGDNTSIWFAQSIRSGEVRLVDYYENAGVGLPHYIQVLKERGYSYGTHWAPHDIQVTEFASGRSRLEAAASLGIRFSVCPNVPLEDGIHAARMLFPRCWFDEVKTSKGREALQHYRRDYNSRINEFKAVPVHDWACFTPDTLVWTRSGTCQIMDLPSKGEVLTPCGWKPYEGPRITRRNARLVAVTLSDGSTVRCTPDHLWLTASGWTSAEALQPTSEIPSCSIASLSISMEGSTDSGLLSGISHVEDNGCIVTCGDERSGIYLRTATSTTATMSPPTTTPRTWNVYLPVNTLDLSTFQKVARNQMPWPAPVRRSGIEAMWEGSGTSGWLTVASRGLSGLVSRGLATIAAKWSTCWSGKPVALRSSAHQPASTLRIVSVKRIDERADTCCIHVPDVEAFVLASGAVVHNSHCADAFRYLAVAQQAPVERRIAQAPPPVPTQWW